MLDQCAISVVPDHFQVKPSLLEADGEFILGDFLIPIQGSYNHTKAKTPDGVSLVYKSVFKVLARGSLLVRTQSRLKGKTQREEQFIYSIELNPRTILWGHNGRTIQDDKELCFSLGIVIHALSFLLVDPSQAPDVIPGVRDNRLSYWSKLELALDVSDPGGRILDAMDNARSPRTRKPTTSYENSVYLKGTEATIKAYDKVSQMSSKHDIAKKNILVGDDPLTRLEVVLKREKLVDFKMFGSENDWPSRKMIGGKSRLSSFTLKRLWKWHFSYFSELRAVYYATATARDKPRDKYPAVLAYLAHKGKITPNELKDALIEFGNFSSSTADRIRISVEEFFAERSEIKAEDVLSDNAYRSPPSLTVKGRKGCDFYLRHFGSGEIYKYERLVRAAYCESEFSERYIPKTDRMYYH